MSHEIKVPVEVFPKVITIELKEKHIRAGDRCNKTGCPFALAFIDAGFHLVSVMHDLVVIGHDGKWHTYMNTPETARMIRGFDNGLDCMMPGKYTFIRDN